MKWQDALLQKLAARKTVKDYTKLLDELTALAVKARDQFHCRVVSCCKQWVPEVRENGKVCVGEDCHWAHLVPRARGKAVRHNPANAVTLCFAHHKVFDALAEAERVKYLAEINVSVEEYFEMQAMSRMLITNFDGAAIAEGLLQQLRELLCRCDTLRYERETILGYWERRFDSR